LVTWLYFCLILKTTLLRFQIRKCWIAMISLVSFYRNLSHFNRNHRESRIGSYASMLFGFWWFFIEKISNKIKRAEEMKTYFLLPIRSSHAAVSNLSSVKNCNKVGSDRGIKLSWLSIRN
jgi:hypothetical protein